MTRATPSFFSICFVRFVFQFAACLPLWLSWNVSIFSALIVVKLCESTSSSEPTPHLFHLISFCPHPLPSFSALSLVSSSISSSFPFTLFYISSLLSYQFTLVLFLFFHLLAFLLICLLYVQLLLLHLLYLFSCSFCLGCKLILLLLVLV